MTEVIVVCEGQTEEAFVRRVLYPGLSPRNVFVQPRLIATSACVPNAAISTSGLGALEQLPPFPPET